MKQFKYSLVLTLVALIWGIAFVAQSEGLKGVEPYTFNALRMLVGSIALLPVIRYMKGKRVRAASQTQSNRKALLIAGVCCGVVLFIASSFQQSGLLYTTPGKAGFVTAMYIIIVPLLGLFVRKRVGIKLWISVAIASFGMYLLCISGTMSLEKGDLLCLVCALFFSLHILVIDHFADKVDGVLLSCIQFIICSLLSAVSMLVFEHPTWEGIRHAWLPILYAGVLSSAVGYTLQIIAQKNVNPTLASLLMSLESVFSMLSGWLILGQTLSVKELIGCFLMFSAIILAQMPTQKINQET